MFKYLNKKTDRPNQKRYEEHPLITPNQSSCTSITSQMSLHVKREVVGPGEGTITQVALEGPVTGVFAEMPCQFVGASEFPAATVPTAMVWLFTSVRSVMRLQMRALGVGLSAPSECAGVCRRTLPWPGAATSLWFGLQQLQRRRWGRQQYPLCVQLHAESLLVHSELVSTLVWSNLHLGGLRRLGVVVWVRR